MKNALILLVLILFTSCDRSNDAGKEQYEAILDAKYSEIYKLSTSVTCTNEADWKFIGIGSKACGGYNGFIPYHKSINEANFLKLVNEYNTLSKEFNEKWGGFSPCDAMMPRKVICIDGKAKLSYE